MSSPFWVIVASLTTGSPSNWLMTIACASLEIIGVSAWIAASSLPGVTTIKATTKPGEQHESCLPLPPHHPGTGECRETGGPLPPEIAEIWLKLPPPMPVPVAGTPAAIVPVLTGPQSPLATDGFGDFPVAEPDVSLKGQGQPHAVRLTLSSVKRPGKSPYDTIL